MKVLVTGTAGFIGCHLARRLLECGDMVIGIDNINNTSLSLMTFINTIEGAIGKKQRRSLCLYKMVM